LNTSNVYVKWRAPTKRSLNGILKSFNVIVRGVNVYENISKILTNITTDASRNSIMLANLTEGVTYTVSVAAETNAGLGPYGRPIIMRLDPVTKQLETSFTYRFSLNNEGISSFVNQSWFVVLLGTVLIIIMAGFGVTVYVKRKHLMLKQSMMGLPSAMTPIKVPPSNNYFMDTSGAIWKSSNGVLCSMKDHHIPDYSPVCSVIPSNTIVDDDNRNR
jgi:roundabout, axon guidance receptor 2